jgi:lysophospholipase L1-like esterase
VTYVEGEDYLVDRTAGTVRRTANFRLPDFRTNVLFGAKNFDHSRYPGFGNTAFFAFVDYVHAPGTPWPIQGEQVALLPRSRTRLAEGGPFRIVAFGDSITAGGDATSSDLIFWKRWAEHLQTRYPRSQVTAMNGATGGDSTVQGLQRLEGKVLKEKPDLVLIGFGMNDHNRGGVPVTQFADNLRSLIGRIRAATSAEIVVFSTFPPNPEWAFGTHQMEAYAAATARVATETGCAFADIYNNWQAMAVRKKPEDLLGNNINHPNDFGHDLYHRVFLNLGL